MSFFCELVSDSYEILIFVEKKFKNWWMCWIGEIKCEFMGFIYIFIFMIFLYSVCFRGIWYIIFNLIFMICRYYYKILIFVYLFI